MSARLSSPARSWGSSPAARRGPNRPPAEVEAEARVKIQAARDEIERFRPELVKKWDIRFVDTVADNVSSGLFVLGGVPTRLDGLDLKQCEMTMERNGEPASSGSSAACLGHPLNAALWLAREMVSLGQPLKAGNVVRTGALGPMMPVQPGDRFEARITGVSTVRTVFAAA